jgi:phosphohistidine phosphatase
MILLMQHGAAYTKEQDVVRGLTEQGIRDTEKVASVLKDKHIDLKTVLHSSKKRAQQTAEVFYAQFGADLEIREESGLNPNDDALSFAARLEDTGILIVGHLPFLQRLLSYLVTRDAEYSLVKFKNSCVICIKKEENADNYQISWIIMPDD